MHAAYQHEPGTLYGCTDCEDNCYCDRSLDLPPGEEVLCLACALENARCGIE